jgi:hypothetical protein
MTNSTDTTDATARRERAIALMREALALLESRGAAQAEAAAHLRDAIGAAHSSPRQEN